MTIRLAHYYHLGMEKEKLKIQVIDVQTGQKLYECQLQESEKAYSFAAEMETLGLDVKVVNPTLSETLGESLGLSNEARQQYRESMDEEIEQHEGSCCFEDTDKKVH